MNPRTQTAEPMGDTVLDLAPLAWLHDELQRALQGALAAVRDYVTAHERSRSADLSAVDAAEMRLQAQALQQAVGALEMVGLVPEARTVAALQAVVERLIERPLAAEPEVIPLVERGVWALQDQLRRHLDRRGLPGLALFPFYRDWRQWVQARAHPADLWMQALPATLPVPKAQRILPSPRVRYWVERFALPLLREGRVSAAVGLARLVAGLARAGGDPSQTRFWSIAAAVFEAVAAQRLSTDVWFKRSVASMLRLHVPSFSGGPTAGVPWEGSAREWLYLVARVDPAPDETLPHAHALWKALGWTEPLRWDPERRCLGQVDPKVVAQALEAVQHVLRAGAQGAGDGREQAVAALADALASLPAPWPLLSSAWRQWGATLATTGGTDVETVLVALGTQTELESLDVVDGGQAQRVCALAARLQAKASGEAMQDPEPWLVERYRAWTEREGARTLVREWRTVLADVESALDALWRRGDELAWEALRSVPQRLRGLRETAVWMASGGIDTALLACADEVAQWLSSHDAGPFTVPPEQADRVSANLAAIAVWLEAWERDPAGYAAHPYVFDRETGLLTRENCAVGEVDEVPPAEESISGDESVDEFDERAIFLEEATELLDELARPLASLQSDPTDRGALGRVRRVFHTLKGSARLVGFRQLGEAAWGAERRLNAWLAEDHVPDPGHIAVLQGVRDALVSWVQAWVEHGTAGDEEERLASVDVLLQRLDAGSEMDAAEVTVVHEGGIGVGEGAANGLGDPEPVRAEPEPAAAEAALMEASVEEGPGTEALDAADCPLSPDSIVMSGDVASSPAPDEAVDTAASEPNTPTGSPLTWLIAADVLVRAGRQQAVWRRGSRTATGSGGAAGSVDRTARRTWAAVALEIRRQRRAAGLAVRPQVARWGWLGPDALAQHLARACADAPALHWQWDIGADVWLEPAVADRLTVILAHLGAVAAALRPGARTVAVRLRNVLERGAIVVECVHDGASLPWGRLHDDAVRWGLHARDDPFTPDDAIRCAIERPTVGPAGDDPWAAVGLGDAGVEGELRALAAQVTCLVPEAGGGGWRLVVPVALSLVAVTVVQLHAQTVGLLATAVDAETRVSAGVWADAQRAGVWRDAQGHAWPIAPVGWSWAASRVVPGDAARVTVVTCRGVGQRAAWAVDAVLDHRVVWLDPAAVSAACGAAGPDVVLPGYVGMGRCADGTVLPVLHPLVGI